MGWVGLGRTGFLFLLQVWPFSQPSDLGTRISGRGSSLQKAAPFPNVEKLARLKLGKGLGEGRGSEGPLNQLLALPGLRGRDKVAGSAKAAKCNPPPSWPPPPVRGKRTAVPKGESRERGGGCGDDGERGETSSRQYHPQSLASSTPPPCPGVCTRPSLSLPPSAPRYLVAVVIVQGAQARGVGPGQRTNGGGGGRVKPNVHAGTAR